MTRSALFRRLARLVGLVVLVFAGWFLIIYLLRWEWNRALIAGVFFLAAELFLAADLLLHRVQALERRADLVAEREQIDSLAALLRRNRPRSAGPFAWLRAPSDRTYVLVPILLGAGLILSGIAFVVERLSRVAAAPVAEHELARGLASMALPASGLMPTGQPPISVWDSPRHREGRHIATIAVMFVAMMAVIFTLIFTLITRPAPPAEGSSLAIDVAVATRNNDQPDEAVLASLWALCEVRVPEEVDLVRIAPAGPGLQRIELSPAPALFDRRELLGCLQDTSIDRAVAEVVAIREAP